MPPKFSVMFEKCCGLRQFFGTTLTWPDVKWTETLDCRTFYKTPSWKQIYQKKAITVTPHISGRAFQGEVCQYPKSALLFSLYDRCGLFKLSKWFKSAQFGFMNSRNKSRAIYILHSTYSFITTHYCGRVIYAGETWFVWGWGRIIMTAVRPVCLAAHKWNALL